MSSAVSLQLRELIASNVSGWHPIGRFIIGIWIGLQGFRVLTTSWPGTSTPLPELVSWIVFPALIGVLFVLVGEAIMNGRPYGWYGGFLISALVVILAVYDWTASFLDFAGIIIALLIAAYLVIRRDVFFEDPNSTDWDEGRAT